MEVEDFCSVVHLLTTSSETTGLTANVFTSLLCDRCAQTLLLL